MNPELIHVPFELIDDALPSFAGSNSAYGIVAVHVSTGKRYLIRVRRTATREQLTLEIRRMNSKPSLFKYSLTNEGAAI